MTGAWLPVLVTAIWLGMVVRRGRASWEVMGGLFAVSFVCVAAAFVLLDTHDVAWPLLWNGLLGLLTSAVLIVLSVPVNTVQARREAQERRRRPLRLPPV